MVGCAGAQVARVQRLTCVFAERERFNLDAPCDQQC